jgi:hypothetical protein
MDATGRTITASDFRKTRQKALAEELIKPSQIEKAYELIHEGLYKLTQELAVIS